MPDLNALIEIDRKNDILVERVKQALAHPLSETFRNCLDTLVRLANNVSGKVRLWKDFAPLSFEFVVIKADGSAWLNGGIIFHGHHDGYGSGGAPTYSVCVDPQDGWSVQRSPSWPAPAPAMKRTLKPIDGACWRHHYRCAELSGAFRSESSFWRNRSRQIL